MITSHGSRILQLVFSLVLGSVPTAVAQLDYHLPNGIQLASVGSAPQSASTSRFINPGDITNQLVALRAVPAPKGNSDPGLSYSIPPSQQIAEGPFNLSSLASRVRLEDLVGAASPYGWRTGGGGLVSYNTRNQRWHLVFRYAPELRTLSDDFDRLHSFSLIWQFSFGKSKPAT
jgi:hypothetical protein